MPALPLGGLAAGRKVTVASKNSQTATGGTTFLGAAAPVVAGRSSLSTADMALKVVYRVGNNGVGQDSILGLVLPKVLLPEA